VAAAAEIFDCANLHSVSKGRQLFTVDRLCDDMVDKRLSRSGTFWSEDAGETQWWHAKASD